ncbi:MAG TPA: SIMPL domain-containing protein [Candidatus Paceibacterota bacterium]|nr:SIMPL domain-containing protein [Candidatus Paceibacterota bacterium]
MKFFDRPFVVPSLFLSAALIIGLWIVGTGIANRGASNVITSTGSATLDVTSNDAKWTVSVYRTANDGATAVAYSEVSQDAAAVESYFKKANLATSTITSTVTVADQQYNNNGPVTYNVHQEITLESGDVYGVQKLAQNIGALTGQGLSVSPQQPQYYVTNLPDIRVQLQGKAVADAKARAQQLAESGGSSIGPLLSASSGVVQVLAPNAISSDDYGDYDTSTIQKEVSVTAHVTFAVK